jgi:hypothetical protein
MNHKVLVIAVLWGIALINSPAMATDVGGIIDIDTTWDLAGSPYNITSTIQVNEGVTLTIEPGVVVNTDEPNPNIRDIQVWGTLNVIGTNNSRVTLNNVTIAGASKIGTLSLQFADVNGGSVSDWGLGDPASLTLLDSKIQDAQYTYISGPSNDCHLERNIFINSGFIDVSTSAGSAQVFIRNNVFYQPNLAAIWNKGDASPPITIIEHNSFLSNDRIALRLGTAPSADMDARNNYWNTTNTNIIDTMIYDRNDDLAITNYVQYEPFLTTPHPDTPILNFNQAPTSDCGTNQEFFDEVAFDEVTLDGSASSDPDGTIVSYDWTLQHRKNPDNDKSATGVNPTVIGLSNGFYDVCLTVTDDLGATDIDCSLLAAAGSCFCTPSTTHVESIVVEISRGEQFWGIIKRKYGKAKVTVHDDCGNPVLGAEVRGTFSGDFNESGTGVTDANGVAVIYTTTVKIKIPSFTFCVDDVVKESLIYELDDNVETCESK